MQGRLEKDLKNERSIEYMLHNMLPEFVRGYYMYLKTAGRTSETCICYLRVIHAYFETLKPIITWEVELSDLSYESLVNYFLSIRYTKNNDGTVRETTDGYKRHVWFALKSFFDYLTKRGLIEKNYMDDIPNVADHDEAKRKNKRVRLTADDYKKMLKVLDEEIEDDITKVENKAVILLLMNTGMRKSALESINLSDVDFENHTLTVIDKGNEEHKYKLNQMCIDCLEEWLKVRNFYTDEYTSALFVNKHGFRLSSRTIAEYVMNNTEKALGVRLGPHKLRAGFCSIMYEQTGDIEKVRRMVGHKQVSTTQRYIVTDNKEKEEAAGIMENLLG